METKETEIVEVDQNNVPMNVDNNQIDLQIRTARAYPRSLKAFSNTALAMATANVDVASSCFYCLPRGGKSIEGPSVRLAEIVGSAWGNLRFGARVIREDAKYIYAEGMAFDLERNVAMTIEIRRKITNKHGKKYTDDMITTTANAACAIALRNAIFKVVPKAFVDPIYNAAKHAAIGDIATLETRRHKMIDHFGKMGIVPERIFKAMGIEGLEDIDLKILEKLTGMNTAINDGDLKIDDAFPSVQAVEESSDDQTKGQKIMKKIKNKKEQLKDDLPDFDADEPKEREPGEEG
jgi:hypothetical protein